jgi:opacity protein-like surface antigen
VIRYGRVLGRQGQADRWQRAHLEWIGELWGGVQSNGRRRTVVGLTPLLRYHFSAGGRWVPFVDGGAGIAHTNIGGRDLSEGWQFNLQAGVGTQYFLRRDLALTLQYRWFHLSNAGLNEPNSGLNTHMAYVGLSRFH